MSNQQEEILDSFNMAASLVNAQKDAAIYLQVTDQLLAKVAILFMKAEGTDEKKALTGAFVAFTVEQAWKLSGQSNEVAVRSLGSIVEKLCNTLMHSEDIDKSWISADLSVALFASAERLLGNTGEGPGYTETVIKVANDLAAKATELKQYTGVGEMQSDHPEPYPEI